MSRKGPSNPRCVKCKSGKDWKEVKRRKKEVYTKVHAFSSLHSE